MSLHKLFERLDMLTAGNRQEAAEAVGVTPQTLSAYRRLDEYDDILSKRYRMAEALVGAAVDRLCEQKGVRFER